MKLKKIHMRMFPRAKNKRWREQKETFCARDDGDGHGQYQKGLRCRQGEFSPYHQIKQKLTDYVVPIWMCPKVDMGIGDDLPSAEVFQWRADFPISENHHGQNPGPVWGKLSGLKDYLDMFLKIVFVVFQLSTHPASIHFSSHWSELLHACCICWTANVTKINYDM